MRRTRILALAILAGCTGGAPRPQAPPTAASATIGCADGEREAFADAVAFPGIAGCRASWTGARSLRGAPTGAACGDDGATCPVPADACAPGWRVCGAKGAVADLTAVTAEQCAQAGPGRFTAALSHCLEQAECLSWRGPEAIYPCFATGWCAEPVCCGDGCTEGACTSGVWPRQTRIAAGTDQGCASLRADRAGGVLCCR